jgi:hypothetical protein
MSHGAAHADPSNPIGKYIGLTMAVLGVLLALCSALVGAARTELIATMVEQTNTSLTYQAVATKHRTLLAQLQQLHAIMPLDPVAFKKSQDDIKKLVVANGHLPIGPLANQLQLTGDMLLNVVVPTPSDVLRFVEIVKLYDKQREAAHEWAESYEDAIKAHSLEAEHFEWGQLGAEIGIVIASIALLLNNKKAWMVSIIMMIISIAVVGWTYTTAKSILTHAEKEIKDAQAHYASTIDEKAEKAGDEKLLADIEAAIPPEERHAPPTPAVAPAAAHGEHGEHH